MTLRPFGMARLLGRGRESEVEVAKRVGRAKEGEPVGPHVIQVINEASRADGVEKVVAALHGKLRYSPSWAVKTSSQRFYKSFMHHPVHFLSDLA
jgi:hypothetical protein